LANRLCLLDPEMTPDDVPVLVFGGAYAEAMFLKTLLESAGIETSFDDTQVSGRERPDSRLYVRPADVEAAREFIQDFEHRGHRTL